MNTPPEISIIIPVYRETKEELISAIKRIKEYFGKKSIKYEVILSYNGIENTDSILKTNINIQSVFTKEKGLGIALTRGIMHAKGTYFYYLPADIPFQFTDSTAMLKKKNTYDLLIGSKLHKDSTYQIAFRRKLLSYLELAAISLLFPTFHIKDVNGTLFGNVSKAKTIFSKHTMDKGYFFSFQFTYLFWQSGYTVHEVPVIYKKTTGKSTIHIFSDSMIYFTKIMLLRIHTLFL